MFQMTTQLYMNPINIQSVSDLITNSSTEVFLTYSSSTADDIRNLVTSILSLVDSSKTFDDYFTIEMNIDYEELACILEDLVDDWDKHLDKFPWIEEYYKEYNERNGYGEAIMESLDEETIKSVFDYYNDIFYNRPRYMYYGYTIRSKVVDPIVDKVIIALESIPSFFGLDYISDY